MPTGSTRAPTTSPYMVTQGKVHKTSPFANPFPSYYVQISCFSAPAPIPLAHAWGDCSLQAFTINITGEGLHALQIYRAVPYTRAHRPAGSQPSHQFPIAAISCLAYCIITICRHFSQAYVHRGGTARLHSQPVKSFH